MYLMPYTSEQRRSRSSDLRPFCVFAHAPRARSATGKDLEKPQSRRAGWELRYLLPPTVVILSASEESPHYAKELPRPFSRKAGSASRC